MFESALLLLFKVCSYCGCLSTQIKKVVNGTFLRVIQTCNDCGKKRVWESQPFIGPRPAGNVLLSSAILYTGSLPSKALRLFQVLKCATISRSAFFRHQSDFMWPSIDSVWKNQQRALLNRFKHEKKSLVVAGDGRADSPGHSAKYGCYTLMELTCSKVVDFKLVQVCKYLLVQQQHYSSYKIYIFAQWS